VLSGRPDPAGGWGGYAKISIYPKFSFILIFRSTTVSTKLTS